MSTSLTGLVVQERIAELHRHAEQGRLEAVARRARRTPALHWPLRAVWRRRRAAAFA
jgi:hypothetical protein